MIGLALLVPVGDLLERRRLIAALLVLTAAGLGLAAAAPDRRLCLQARWPWSASSAVVAQIVVADVLLTCRGA